MPDARAMTSVPARCADPDPRVECSGEPFASAGWPGSPGNTSRCSEHEFLRMAGDRVCDQPTPALCSWRGYMGDSAFDDDDFACDQPARWCYRQPDRHRPSCSDHVVRFIDDVVMGSFERIPAPGRTEWHKIVAPSRRSTVVLSLCAAGRDELSGATCQPSLTHKPRWRIRRREGNGAIRRSRHHDASSRLAATVAPSVRMLPATAIARARVSGARAVPSALARDSAVGTEPSCAVPMPSSATRRAQCG